MSTQFDAKHGEVASDEWKTGSKGRKPISLPYIIQWRFRRWTKELQTREATRRARARVQWVYVMSDEWGEWHKMKAYKSQDQRDRVYEKLMRDPYAIGRTIEYRTVNL